MPSPPMLFRQIQNTFRIHPALWLHTQLLIAAQDGPDDPAEQRAADGGPNLLPALSVRQVLADLVRQP